MLADKVIDPKLLEIIGYRIPTEGHYSVWPLKVKGFLHRNGGNNIVMPKEVTTILGVDFDIDTMYLMFKEHNFITKIDNLKKDRDFREANPEWQNVLNNALEHSEKESLKNNTPLKPMQEVKKDIGYTDALQE